MFRPSELEFLEALIDSAVQFIVIGGHAVVHYGYVRVVNDLDIWIKPSKPNAARFCNALMIQPSLRFTDEELSEIGEKAANPKLQIPFTVFGFKIDVLTSLEPMDLVNFDDAFKTADKSLRGRFTIPIISMAQLIWAKKQRAEDKDLEDIRALEKICSAKIQP